MMNCPKCGAEYKVLRDEDDTRYRRLCPCEVLNDCHRCKRGKVTHALLTRTGEVSEYACSKHGSPDASDWLPLGAPPVSKGRALAEEAVAAKLKGIAEAKAPAREGKRATEPKKEPSPPASPHGLLTEELPLRDAQCAPCSLRLLTSLSTPHCPQCGRAMSTLDLERACLDFAESTHGPNGASVLLLARMKSESPYDLHGVLVVRPR